MSRSFARRGYSPFHPVPLMAIIIALLLLLVLLESGALSPENIKAYAQDSEEVTIVEMVLSKGISDGEPLEPAAQVSLSQGKIYTWTKVKANNTPTFIKHVYYHEGKKLTEITLDIKFPSFRTWSEKTLKGNWTLGQWRVEVISPDDKLLVSKEFTVTE